MKLIFQIPSTNLKEAYRAVRVHLSGQDDLIFRAMAKVTQASQTPFVLPTNSTQNADKHEEIETKFDLRAALHGVKTAVDLFEVIWAEAISEGISNQTLLNSIVFETDRDVKVRLTNDSHWIAQWTVQLQTHFMQDESEASLAIHQKTWGEIVPTYIVEYINSAIYAYRMGMYGAAIALLSIAVEGTLRDVLVTKGYTFKQAASSVDIFQYAKANIEVHSNSSYIVTFLQSMPKLPNEFLTSTSGSTNVEIEIRRKINQKKNRIDLDVKIPLFLIDHLSVDTISQPGEKRVNGLGEAFNIARNVEHFLTPTDLAIDLDEVIKVVRNNLIHLSGEALNTRLPVYDGRNSINEFKLKDFINDPEMVYDFIRADCDCV